MFPDVGQVGVGFHAALSAQLRNSSRMARHFGQILRSRESVGGIRPQLRRSRRPVGTCQTAILFAVSGPFPRGREPRILMHSIRFQPAAD